MLEVHRSQEAGNPEQSSRRYAITKDVMSLIALLLLLLVSLSLTLSILNEDPLWLVCIINAPQKDRFTRRNQHVYNFNEHGIKKIHWKQGNNIHEGNRSIKNDHRQKVAYPASTPSFLGHYHRLIMPIRRSSGRKGKQNPPPPTTCGRSRMVKERLTNRVGRETAVRAARALEDEELDEILKRPPFDPFGDRKASSSESSVGYFPGGNNQDDWTTDEDESENEHISLSSKKAKEWAAKVRAEAIQKEAEMKRVLSKEWPGVDIEGFLTAKGITTNGEKTGTGLGNKVGEESIGLPTKTPLVVTPTMIHDQGKIPITSLLDRERKKKYLEECKAGLHEGWAVKQPPACASYNSPEVKAFAAKLSAENEREEERIRQEEEQDYFSEEESVSELRERSRKARERDEIWRYEEPASTDDEKDSSAESEQRKITEGKIINHTLLLSPQRKEGSDTKRMQPHTPIDQHRLRGSQIRNTLDTPESLKSQHRYNSNKRSEAVRSSKGGGRIDMQPTILNPYLPHLPLRCQVVSTYLRE